ncbi:MAG: hypothetical protein WDZ31_09475 [Phycisphaeraceae bacterium]
MSEHDARVRVDRLDWPTVLPWLALFRTARMALHPSKLGLALLLTALLYMGGMALDVIWGVPAGAVEAHQLDQPEPWSDLADLRAAAVEARRVSADAGVFEATVAEQQRAFGMLVRSAVALDFGVSRFLGGRGLASGGVMEALGHMLVVVPRWLVGWHPVFLLVYFAWAFFITAILGGAIARLAAQHACSDRRGSPTEALRFVGRRYPWFFLAPLIPAVLVMVIGVTLVIVGLLFNLPGLDIVGAVGYGLMLLAGVAAALLLVGLATGGHLLLPALAVEGTDAFDAISRAYSYVFGRPWRYLFYSALALVYGAVVYLALSLALFLALWLTWMCAGAAVFTEAEQGGDRFAAMLAQPGPAELLPRQETQELGVTGGVASIVLRGWTMLFITLLPAFAISYYFCANTWIYLLLRQAVDGTEMDDLFVEARPEAGVPPEKIEPAEG